MVMVLSTCDIGCSGSVMFDAPSRMQARNSSGMTFCGLPTGRPPIR